MTRYFFPLLVLFITAYGQPSIAPPADQKMSIDVKDTDIRDVIRMISKGYDINILLDQDVTGKVTLHLVDVPIMEGLRTIAASNNLEVVQDGSVYYIRKATAEKRAMIRYGNGKLTVDVQNVDVRDFLKELSSKSAVSIVPDAKVEGNISGKLYQVNLDDGLRALLEGNGFTVLKRKNIYQVSISGEKQSSTLPGGPGAMRSRGRVSSNDMYVDYTDGRVSVDVVNGDLEEIIGAIAEQSDAEIITYGSIKTEINAKLNDAPLTEALALLLGGTRFTFVQKDNVILIGDRNTATPSGIALSKSELIHLKHIKADNIPAILPKDIPATNVRVIKEQNALLISGTSEDIVSAIEFLRTIDIPTPQVRIDAVIVEFKENLDKEFAVRGGRDWRLMDSTYFLTPFPKTLHSSTSNQHFEIGVSGSWFKKVIRSMVNKSSLGLLDDLPDDFFTILRFLETQDKAKVLAQPSIMTLNGNKASIDVSETQYFKVETGVGESHTSRFQPIKFGIQLDIVPWISQSGQITAEITPNVSNSEKTNNEGYPNVSTRSVNTTVRLNDGQTLILGGLVKNQETTFQYKIPFLGDLPLLGPLFRNSGKTRNKTNLIVFITPHIIKGDSNVDLEKELEKFEIHDMNFLEKSIHDGVKKLRSRKSRRKERKESSDSLHQKRNEEDTSHKPPATGETFDSSAADSVVDSLRNSPPSRPPVRLAPGNTPAAGTVSQDRPKSRSVTTPSRSSRRPLRPYRSGLPTAQTPVPVPSEVEPPSVPPGEAPAEIEGQNSTVNEDKENEVAPQDTDSGKAQ